MTEFKVEVSQEVLDDLASRLTRIRWPLPIIDDWSWGAPVQTVQKLVERWRSGYDWRASEARINSLEQHRVILSGIGVHFFRAGTRGKPPLLLLHGWPDSPLRFEKAIPFLAPHFDLIMPSVPGYGFSDQPTEPGYGPHAIADLFAKLLSELNFSTFLVHGGDIGSVIGESLALRHPEHVTALHLADVPFWHRYTTNPATLNADEANYFQAMAAWATNEGAYAALHRTKPQTIAYSLDNSPVGLAAWILEKFQAWSDCNGDVWSRFSIDEIIDNLMIYWITQSAGSSVRYYRDMAQQTNDPDSFVKVPTAFAVFPHDIPPAPRAYAERFFNVQRWTTMPRGGHFGAWEEPKLFADDIIAFVKELFG